TEGAQDQLPERCEDGPDPEVALDRRHSPRRRERERVEAEPVRGAPRREDQERVEEEDADLEELAVPGEHGQPRASARRRPGGPSTSRALAITSATSFRFTQGSSAITHTVWRHGKHATGWCSTWVRSDHGPNRRGS